MRRKKCLATVVSLLLLVSWPAQARTLFAVKTDEPPLVDGQDHDPIWQKAPPLVVRDPVAGREVVLKAAYDARTVYFLVTFPDADESRLHKSWVWDTGRGQYVMGPMREDVFVFKWSMEATPVDLSIHSAQPHRADIWFWKANRTDPVGFADDKLHVLSQVATRHSTRVTTGTGGAMYLLRQEDSGHKAYTINLLIDYAGDRRDRYTNVQPSGSRADVRAKGSWQEGRWSLEFARALVTGHSDDLQFGHQDRPYQFGISTLEIAGRRENPKLSEPLYGCGDVGEDLELVFTTP